MRTPWQDVQVNSKTQFNKKKTKTFSLNMNGWRSGALMFFFCLFFLQNLNF